MLRLKWASQFNQFRILVAFALEMAHVVWGRPPIPPWPQGHLLGPGSVADPFVQGSDTFSVGFSGFSVLVVSSPGSKSREILIVTEVQGQKGPKGRCTWWSRSRVTWSRAPVDNNFL